MCSNAHEDCIKVAQSEGVHKVTFIKLHIDNSIASTLNCLA